MSDVVKTPEQVRAEFSAAGVSIGGWARRNGFSRTMTYGLLTGRLKGTYGEAHKIAVALGIKPGVIVDQDAFRSLPQQEAA